MKKNAESCPSLKLNLASFNEEAAVVNTEKLL